MKVSNLRQRHSPSLYDTPKEIPLPNEDSADVNSTHVPFPIIEEAIEEDNINDVLTQSIHERPVWDCSPPHGSFWNNKSVKGMSNAALECLLEPIRSKADKEYQSEGFYDTEIEDETESSYNFATPCGEFYDACEELSSESGTQSSVDNIETEQREIRLGLLMEIDKRKQAEEILEQMQVHWWRLRQQLADVGLFLPLDPTRSQYSINVADELRCQIEVAKLDNAEVVMEMESEIEANNFEITRLSERLHYYETVNQEMCQRNQEAIEVARQERHKKKRRQRWFWGSIAATITLSSAVLAWSAGILSSESDVAQPQPLSENEVKLQAL